MGALTNITSFWTGLTGPGRRLIVGAVVIFAVGLFLLMRISGQVDYATVASATTLADAAAITSELEAQGIPYRTRDGGTTVQVPSDSLDQARLGLASSNAGLGAGGMVGYDIFDQQGWGATDFTQRVNLLRARQGDLSRTIAQLDQVSTANVKLAMPEKRLFASEDTPTTAGVLVSLVPGAVLEPGQVTGITRLVAMAVPGLTPKNVTVTDTQGNVLSAAGEGTAGNAGIRMELERQTERAQQAKIDALLARQLGPGLAAAQVDVTLDLDSVNTRSEVFGKVRNPPTIDSDTSRETVDQQGSGTTGVAGASANSPGNTFPTTTGGNGTTKYDKTTSRTRSGVDKTLTSRVGVSGTIARQSVSVQVDDEFTGDVAALEESIKAAVGFDEARGDVVTVQKVAFAETAVADAQAEAEAAKTPQGAPLDIMGIAKTAGAVIGALLIVMLARRGLSRRESDLEKALPKLLAQGPVPVGALTAGAGDRAGGIAQRLEGETKSAVEQQMEDLALRKPDDMAKLMRSWLIERR